MASHTRRKIPEDARFGTWTGADGWCLRRLDLPASGLVKGTLVFAGGRGDFIEKYLEPQAHWRAAGWNVVAIDWRGQGGSRGTIVRGHVEDFAPLTADLAALLRTLDGPVVVVGHSMGGHLALRTLIEHRPQVIAAVLVTPMIDVNSGPIPAWLGARLAALATRFGLSRRPLVSGSFGPAPPGSPRQAILTGCAERYADELHWWEREPGYSLGPPSWGWLHAAYTSAAAFFDKDQLASVATPLLLLGTDRDRLVRPAAIRKAAAMLPNAELHMYPDAGHEILRETDAVRLDALARIDAFLDRHR